MYKTAITLQTVAVLRSCCWDPTTRACCWYFLKTFERMQFARFKNRVVPKNIKFFFGWNFTLAAKKRRIYEIRSVRCCPIFSLYDGSGSLNVLFAALSKLETCLHVVAPSVRKLNKKFSLGRQAKTSNFQFRILTMKISLWILERRKIKYHRSATARICSSRLAQCSVTHKSWKCHYFQIIEKNT